MKQSFLRVIVPTLNQTLSCLGVSILTIGFLYRSQVWQRLQTGALTSVLGDVSVSNRLTEATKSPIMHTFVIVAFWSAVGLVAYTIVWSMINVLIEARNEVVLETAYTNKATFISRAKTPLVQLALAAALFIGLFASARYVLPFWLHLAFTGIYTSNSLMMLADLVAAIIGMAATIYVLLLLGQLIFWVG